MNSYKSSSYPGALWDGAERCQAELLVAIRQGFYTRLPPRHFYRDRRLLLYAITWPATWLEQRGLTCSADRYIQIVTARLEAILVHGDPAEYGVPCPRGLSTGRAAGYFPAYLLKCLQDHFRHHGECLYDELKHVRNSLAWLMDSLPFTATPPAPHPSHGPAHTRHVETLAAVHRLLAPKKKPPPSAPAQLTWW